MAKNTWGAVETAKSPQGKASIRFSKKEFLVEFDDGSLNRKFDIDDWPENAPREKKKGLYWVVLNGDQNKVVRVGPIKGIFNMHCVDFVREKEGEPPKPQERRYKRDYGGKNTYRAFTATFEILEGPFKGCTIGKFLHYKFTRDEDGMAVFKGRPGTMSYDSCVAFCEVTGVTEKPMKWDEEDGNILPEMLHVIRKKDYTVECYVKDGFIDDMSPTDATDFDEESDEESEEVETDDGFDDSDLEGGDNEPIRKKKASNKSREDDDFGEYDL